MRRFREMGLCLGMMLLASSAAAAETVQIWYRGSNGCPEASDFVRRLAALGRSARLAGVGDPVDFVVTVASTPEHSEGRLERQTQSGTMAIREVRAPRCEQVADGLALSLDLALAPARDAKADAQPRVAPSTDVAPSPASPKPSADPQQALALGVEALLSTTAAPAALPGVGVFLELPFGAASLRLALRGQRGEGDSRAVTVMTTLLAARAEGCVEAWAGGNFSVSPCLALDVGWLTADTTARGGRSDGATWASGSALGRLNYAGSSPVEVSVYAGAQAPFVRYDLGADTGPSVFRSRALGVDAGLGVGWRFR